MSGELVLVTGGSGFIGAHTIVQLLNAGYRVRTTVRSLKREADVRSMIKAGGVEAGDRLSFAEADLSSDDGWPEAVAGCAYVLHIASPFPVGKPKHEDDLIIPARDGALRLLRAAKAAGVKRVVLTSSFAAIGYGGDHREITFDEKHWTDADSKKVSAYAKSKTLAERAAWDFINNQGGSMELAVVNPVAVFGPVLGPDYSTSIQIVSRLLDGSVPALPRMAMGVVDVRDVADLHLRAMTNPAARGERFLAVAGDFMASREIVQVLRRKLGDSAKNVPTRILPDWMVRMLAPFNESLAAAVPMLGVPKKATNEKARRLLGWSPRSNEEAIVSTAESLIRFGLVQGSPGV